MTAGYCPHCGHHLETDGACPRCSEQRLETDTQIPGPELGVSAVGTLAVRRKPGERPGSMFVLPKASLVRRLLGSGIEYFVYCMAIFLFSVIGLFASGGLFGILWVPLMLAMVGLRDLNAGTFSLGKRVGNMRVVDRRTALPASNSQALLRNSYYLVLVTLMLVPIVKFVFEGFFFVLMITDAMMVIASPTGRRLGDHLAGTQVVQVSAARS